jgi:hypothetical protein
MLIGLLLISSPVSAAYIGPRRVGGMWAYPTDICVSGEIELGDAEVFASVTRGYPSGSLIRLEGPGGNVSAAFSPTKRRSHIYRMVGDTTWISI